MNPVIERTDYLEQAKPEAVKTKRRMNGEIFWGYLFILPTIGAFILFSLIPTISVFALSLFKWDMINNPVYIGFQNYADMFANKDFWHSAREETERSCPSGRRLASRVFWRRLCMR